MPGGGHTQRGGGAGPLCPPPGSPGVVYQVTAGVAAERVGWTGRSCTAGARARTRREARLAATASLNAHAVSSGEVDLSWAAAAGATSYRVERALSGGAFAEIASGVTGTTYMDHAVQPGTAYQYRVRAQNSEGTGSYSPV